MMKASVVVGVPEGPEPVQVVPLSAKLVGAGLLVAHEPLKPKLVLPPVGMAPL